MNKCVFSRSLKSMLRAGSRKLSGNAFQTDGPSTEKARGPTRGPNVLSWHRGTTRNRRVADRRC